MAARLVVEPPGPLRVGDHVLVRDGNLGAGNRYIVHCLFGGPDGDRFAGLAHHEAGRQVVTYATHKLVRA